MKIRKLNEDGIKEFEDRIKALRDGSEDIDMTSGLIDNVKYTEEIEDDLHIENKDFKNRYELGEYLNNLMKGVTIQKYMGNNSNGFWNWIALFLFEDLCPKKGGIRKPLKSYYYILSSSFQEHYRHSIYSPWELVYLLGKEARFMLVAGKKIESQGELAEQMLSRQHRKYQKSVIEVASKLYMDTKLNKTKVGSKGKGPGAVRHFVSYIAQIEQNYDLNNISMNKLFEILPAQFDKYK